MKTPICRFVTLGSDWLPYVLCFRFRRSSPKMKQVFCETKKRRRKTKNEKRKTSSIFELEGRNRKHKTYGSQSEPSTPNRQIGVFIFHFSFFAKIARGELSSNWLYDERARDRARFRTRKRKRQNRPLVSSFIIISLLSL